MSPMSPYVRFGQPVAKTASAAVSPQAMPAPPPTVAVPALPQPGVAVAQPQADAYQKMLEDNLKAATAQFNGMQRPAEPTIINTIRGNRMGREIPVMEANAIANYNRAQSNVMGNQAALNAYQSSQRQAALQQDGAQAEVEGMRAKTDQLRSQASIFSDPNRMAAYLVAQGVPLDQAQQATAAIAPGGQAKGGEVSARNLPSMLRQPENEYLRQFFDPAHPLYAGNAAATPGALFQKIMQMSPRDAQDPTSPLAKIIMQSMQQKYPDGFGGYPTSSPDEFEVPGMPRAFFPSGWFNQNIGGPILSVMTGGRAPTWDWRANHEQGKFFDEFIKKYNAANQQQQPQGIGVPIAPVPGLVSGGG